MAVSKRVPAYNAGQVAKEKEERMRGRMARRKAARANNNRPNAVPGKIISQPSDDPITDADVTLSGRYLKKQPGTGWMPIPPLAMRPLDFSSTTPKTVITDDEEEFLNQHAKPEIIKSENGWAIMQYPLDVEEKLTAYRAEKAAAAERAEIVRLFEVGVRAAEYIKAVNTLDRNTSYDDIIPVIDLWSYDFYDLDNTDEIGAARKYAQAIMERRDAELHLESVELDVTHTMRKLRKYDVSNILDAAWGAHSDQTERIDEC